MQQIAHCFTQGESTVINKQPTASRSHSLRHDISSTNTGNTQVQNQENKSITSIQGSQDSSKACLDDTILTVKPLITKVVSDPHSSPGLVSKVKSFWTDPLVMSKWLW